MESRSKGGNARFVGPGIAESERVGEIRERG
jgi:hypothetical protein